MQFLGEILLGENIYRNLATSNLIQAGLDLKAKFLNNSFYLIKIILIVPNFISPKF